MAQPQTPEPHSSEPAPAASANGSDPAKPPTPPKPSKPPKSRIVPWLIGLPVAFFAVLMLAGQLLSTPEGEARWVERETIKICRKDRKSTRLNSSHGYISYAVFCLKKK